MASRVDAGVLGELSDHAQRGLWYAVFDPAGGQSDTGDAAGPDAVGANAHPFMGFADNHPNLLEVGIPPSPGQVVSMTDPITVNRTFVTYFAALRHEAESPR